MIFVIFLFVCLSCCKFFGPSDSMISYIGRFAFENNGDFDVAKFDWSGSVISTKFKGDSLTIHMNDYNHDNYFNVIIDGSLFEIIETKDGVSKYTIDVSKLGSGFHELLITKRTEAMCGTTNFLGLEADDLYYYKPNYFRKILFLGDSLTVGYGDEGKYPCRFSHATENNYPTFDGLIARNFSANYHVVAWSGKGMVRNYGEKGHTSKQPLPFYLNFICGSNESCANWNWRDFDVEAIVVYLGANDFSDFTYRPTEEEYLNGYNSLMNNLTSKFKTYKPYYFFVCGDMVPSKEHPWCDYVEKAKNYWVEKYGQKVTFINNSNLLKYPEEEGCDGHPNLKGHQTWANNMIPIIKKATGW